MEFMALGDLSVILKPGKARDAAERAGLVLTELGGKLRVLLDIASACQYLETRKVVHRDIAARNGQ